MKGKVLPIALTLALLVGAGIFFIVRAGNKKKAALGGNKNQGGNSIDHEGNFIEKEIKMFIPKRQRV